MPPLLILAAVQGVTEFLPVSSSGHLALAGLLAPWPDQGLAMDVAAHVGTLLAVMIYLRRDIWRLAASVLRPGGAAADRAADRRLALHVVLATLPLIVAGPFLYGVTGGALRSIEVIAWATIGFGVLLWLADRLGPRRPGGLRALSWRGAALIGLAQILALIPGCSRSGITMTAGRLCGLDRVDAARFSLLLSIPAIAGAGVLAVAEMWRAGAAPSAEQAAAMLGVAGLSCAAGLVAIVAMMAWLRRAGFGPFVAYRLALGATLLAWVYGGA